MRVTELGVVDAPAAACKPRIEDVPSRQAVVSQFNQFLSQMAALSAHVDLFSAAARELVELIDACFVAINLYHAEQNVLVCRALATSPGLDDLFHQFLGPQPVGFSVPVMSGEMRQGILSGRMTQLQGGIHELTVGAIPRDTLLTAYDDPALVERASQAGVGAYLLKPPDAREIERAVTVALARFGDQQRLRQLNADLTAYNRSVSHDLRNALGFLSMSSEMLLEGSDAMEEEDLRTLLQQMNATAQRSLNIIDSLLWLARPAPPPPTQLNMHRIVADVCAMLNVLYRDRAPRIVHRGDLPDAVGHAGLVERVWDNYIGNAIKYGGRPAYIELGGESSANDQVRYWVRDNGDGIPPEMQPHVFEPFLRLAEDSARGFGLGLPLVRRIVERLGGVCGVESSGFPGEGALFYFTLPAKGDDGAAQLGGEP